MQPCKSLPPGLSPICPGRRDNSASLEQLAAASGPFRQWIGAGDFADSMLQKLDQPIVIQRVKETFYLHIQYPVHLLTGDRNKCNKCIMPAAPKPRPITESDDVLLVDNLQHPHHCLLDDLVFQPSDAQRSRTTRGFGNVYSLKKVSPDRLPGEFAGAGPRCWPPHFARIRAMSLGRCRPLRFSSN